MHPHRNANGKLESNRTNGFLSPRKRTQGDTHVARVADSKPMRMSAAKDNRYLIIHTDVLMVFPGFLCAQRVSEIKEHKNNFNK